MATDTYMELGGEIPFKFEAPGDILAGTYLAYEEFWYQNGDPGIAYRIGGTDGNVYSVVGGKGLIRHMDKLRTGYPIEITYTGDIDTGKPSQMREYKVRFPQAALKEDLPALNSTRQARPYQVGGMPAPRMADSPRPPDRPAPLQTLAYTPGGVPIFGYTPDGTPLDAYGRIIQEAMM